MFDKFKKLKLNIHKKINEHQEEKAIEALEVEKESSTKIFLNSLSNLIDGLFPFIDPMERFDGGNTYEFMDEINFRTPEDRYYRAELVEMTGLQTIVYKGGYGSDRWSASNKEYKEIFGSRNSKKIKGIKKALETVFAKIQSNKGDYTNFIEKYLETIDNMNDIINEYGMTFILSDNDLVDRFEDLVKSFVQDYTAYTEAVRTYKKEQLLNKISIEQQFVNNRIEESQFLLDFPQK